MTHINNRLSAKHIAYDLICCVIGSALVGMALSVFTVPNNIAPGGVSGLATALAYVTGIHVSVLTLALNIPILLAAWRSLNLDVQRDELILSGASESLGEMLGRYISHLSETKE